MGKARCQTNTFDKSGESGEKTFSRLGEFLAIYGLEIRGTWKTPGWAEQALILAGWMLSDLDEMNRKLVHIVPRRRTTICQMSRSDTFFF